MVAPPITNWRTHSDSGLTSNSDSGLTSNSDSGLTSNSDSGLTSNSDSGLKKSRVAFATRLFFNTLTGCFLYVRE